MTCGSLRRAAGIGLVVCLSAAPMAAWQSGDALASRDLLQQIATLLERGELAAAGRLLDPGLQAHPADPVLHNLAGVVAAQRGEFEASEAHFRTSIQLAPRAPAAYENLARLYQVRADRPEMRAKALEVYRRLLEIDPGHVDAIFQTSFLLSLDGQFEASRAGLDHLPPAVRQRPQALAVEAVDLIGVERAADAQPVIAALLAHPDLAEADVIPLLSSLPEDRGGDEVIAMLEGLDGRALASAGTLKVLAARYQRASRFADARRVLERTVALEGATVPVLIELARSAARMADAHSALEYLARARALEPDNASVHFFFGLMCVEEDLVSEAYDSLQRAVALDPENPLINYAMGAVATHRHEPSESLPYFEKYVRLRPDDPRGRFALGVALFYSNQFDAARAPLQRAAQAPETAAGAHYFLGRIARQANDLAMARREVERALEVNPNLPDAWAELGLIQTRAGEYEEAERSLGKVVAMDPDHYAAAVALATLYARTRDPRREAQAARVAALIQQREARAREFFRIIKVIP